MKRIITGLKATGEQLHLGNLIGAELPFDSLIEGNDAAIFIADLHSLTSVKDGPQLRKNVMELALTYLSVHWLEREYTIFRQSDIPALPKLNWILANVTPLSLMLRAHSYKDAQAKVTDMNMGTFTYPILMAADIIGYDIDIVPVGQDQKQHVEMARDIARAFNKTYGEDVFIEPQEYIRPEVATLPGIDGRKMSKSYGNFIGIFDSEAVMKKKIMSIVTDSKWVDEPKDPETCHVFALMKVMASVDRLVSIREKYLAGGYGYGHAKRELLEIALDFLSPIRMARTQLEQDLAYVESRLVAGALKMNGVIDTKMEKVSELVGV